MALLRDPLIFDLQRQLGDGDGDAHGNGNGNDSPRCRCRRRFPWMPSKVKNIYKTGAKRGDALDGALLSLLASLRLCAFAPLRWIPGWWRGAGVVCELAVRERVPLEEWRGDRR